MAPQRHDEASRVLDLAGQTHVDLAGHDLARLVVRLLGLNCQVTLIEHRPAVHVAHEIMKASINIRRQFNVFRLSNLIC